MNITDLCLEYDAHSRISQHFRMFLRSLHSLKSRRRRHALFALWQPRFSSRVYGGICPSCPSCGLRKELETWVIWGGRGDDGI